MIATTWTGRGSEGLTCLRKTRTSEDSAFVANFNEAQGRFMRKEVDGWYKDTKNRLRSVSDNQQKLYLSLLELSKKKKSIKLQRDVINMQKFERPRKSQQQQGDEQKELNEESDAFPPKKRQRQLRPLKMRPNPSEELNTKSSIQAMQGKLYQVSSYRRDVKGSLQEESKTVDTTVDVSQYFNFKYYRDRHTRQKLLEESRLIGGEQRKRVNDFLTKLRREEEKVRTKAELKAKQMEEETMKIQNDTASRKPPRYGLMLENSAPGYVRKYIRRSNIGASDRREKRRSSWYTPSLHTLHLKTPRSSRSILHNNEAMRAADIQLIECSCSAHLVDMKLENYIKAAASMP